MESLATELVWLVTNYQAWVVGVLLFGDLLALLVL